MRQTCLQGEQRLFFQGKKEVIVWKNLNLNQMTKCKVLSEEKREKKKKNT